LEDRPEIAATLGAIFKLICIDEVQDTQDLQYAILAKIYNCSMEKSALFIVGDINQAIYESIGGLSKSLEEMNQEFKNSHIVSFTFSDNYRSTQHIADYFSYFRNTQGILSKADYAGERGKIAFSNQEVDRQNIPEVIANIVQAQIDYGVIESEICIIAPQWSHIRSMSKKLVILLPNVKFDAPSLSPFYGQQDNFWLIVAKLALTTPSGRLFSTRMRWANETITSLNDNFHKTIDITAKKLLSIINSFKTETSKGTTYLRECFVHVLTELEIDINDDSNLAEAHALFFEKSEKNMEVNKDEYEDDIEVFRSFFKESMGVVINSCHGIKGEEFETVIAFGLLNGYIPNWSDIIDKPIQVANDAESKMMYVITSRAKKNLYLISESGRQTQSKRAYETSYLLNKYNYVYDLF
jgi:superfamily I DNA/RNA helicase